MIDFTEMTNLLDSKQYNIFRSKLLEQNEVDIAAFIETLSREQCILVFRMLPKDIAAEVFANLYFETQQTIIEALNDKEIAVIIEEMYLDDAVDFIEEMPAFIVKKVLASATEDTRTQINHLLNYPENSAGTIMTVEYVSLGADMTVKDAFLRIRKTGIDKETIYTCYVTDSSRRLEGIVSVKNLLLSDPESRIGDIMDKNIIFANTLEDQEAIAHLFERYDFISIPVVDSENRLVGIITVDDILDVVQEETTEDFEKMAAMRPSEKPYLKTSVLDLAKNRIIWLIILMFSAMITGGILASYELAIASVPLLVTFIPMLTDTGGNAGSQSSTMIIRGMALHEINLKDFFKVFWKELRTSLLVGTLLSALNFLRIYIQYPGQIFIGITVTISLLLTVIIAQTLGGLLPIVAKICKVDPAVMAAPLITTIVDAFSLVIFFSIASRLIQF